MRVTILIDDELEKKIRVMQANEILKTGKPVSFSKTCNSLFRKGLEE